MIQTIYKSLSMERLVQQAKIASSSAASVFITGENGVGKEHIARILHDEGPRASFPFMAVNCAALPRELIESELFGSKKGSYSGSIQSNRGLFRETGQGTIFLDEIAEMPIEVQSKLLRVLQDRQVRAVGDTTFYPLECRIVAATNRAVNEAFQAHKLRADLYYRLAVISLNIPPLRERRDDIPALVEYFINKYSKEENKQVTLASDLMDFLGSSYWQGNVRQLQNAIHQAIIFSHGHLRVDDFQFVQHEAPETVTVSSEPSFNIDELIKRTILEADKEFRGNKLRMAKAMGIGRQTLYNTITRLNIVLSE